MKRRWGLISIITAREKAKVRENERPHGKRLPQMHGKPERLERDMVLAQTNALRIGDP